MIKSNAVIKMDYGKISKLTRAAVVALEDTAKALHTEVVQAQVVPFDDTVIVTEERTYGKRGRFAKNGREYKGKLKRTEKKKGGNLQNESMFVDTTDSGEGVVHLVHATPYARRLYYHPEYNFDKGENPNAKGHWFEDWEEGGSKSGFVKNAFKKSYKQNGGL